MDFGKRLLKAFKDSCGITDRQSIAEALGYGSAKTVYKLINGERELDFDGLRNFRNSTKCRIDWLLTGEGPMLDAEAAEYYLDRVIEEKMREMLGKEFPRGSAPQELGNIDDFDPEAALERRKNPYLVIEDWYRFEGIEVEEVPGVEMFQGWESKGFAEMIDAIRDYKAVLDKTAYKKKRRKGK